MNLLLMALIICISDPNLSIVVEGLYQPIAPKTFAQLEDGAFVVLDAQSCRLLFFDPRGTQTKIVGRAGEGPGEMAHPHALYRVGDRLYVSDAGNAHVFALDGRFIEKKKPTKVGDMLRKVADGWIINRKTTPLRPEDSKTAYLLWVDDGLAERQTLARYPETDGHQWADGHMTLLYNPAKTKMLMAFNATGTRVCVHLPGEPYLRLFDVMRGKEVAQPALGFQPIPFDPAYGERAFHKARKANPMADKVTLRKNFPDHFPMVTQLTWTAENQILAIQRLPTRQGISQFRHFNPTGTETDSPIPPERSDQVLAIKDGQALLALFDPNTDTPTLISCKEAELVTRLTQATTP